MVLKKIKDFVRNYSLGLNWQLIRTAIIGLSVIILVAIILVIASYFAYKPEEISRPPVSPPPSAIEEILKPGTVGEVSPEAEVIKLSPVIFNTTGLIKEAQSDKLIVEGSGSNFSDQESRELTVIFTPTTLTFLAGQKIKYQGLDGLKYLKAGMEILIEGEENIRGKTEFDARTINIL